ncbi:MAG: hypothetical protein C0418_06380 [Coriobacteriaceae bacterium]|nr:hypothetical protein [Coriobacteriaceae bacterium]
MIAGCRPRVVMDACVLYPAVLRDVVLTAADARLFDPVWSERILAETDRALARRRPPLTPEQRGRLFSEMDRAFPGARVTFAEDRSDEVPPLPDPDDRHVVACAFAGNARYVLTLNLGDFPESVLSPLGLRALHPDVFLQSGLARHPRELRDVLDDVVRGANNPPLTRDQILDALARTAPRFAAAMRERR